MTRENVTSFFSICISLAFSSLALTRAQKDLSAKHTAQPNKMKACNERAGYKQPKGDVRKSFVSACLKG